MLYVYVFRFILVMLASAILFYKSSFLAGIYKSNRFVIGVSSTPLVISLFDYSLGLIWPGAPAFLFRYGVLVISLVYLILHRNYLVIFRALKQVVYIARKTIKKIDYFSLSFAAIGVVVSGLFFVSVACLVRENPPAFLAKLPITNIYLTGVALMVIIALYIFWELRKAGFVSVERNLTEYALFILVSFLSMCVLFQAVTDTRNVIPGWDESHYCMQARIFVEDRNSWEIDEYTGANDGAVFPDDHGPLWELYSADAAFFANDGVNDGIIRLSHSICGLLFFIALVNIGYICGGVMCAALSPTFLLIYRFSLPNVFDGSRDGFRLIALFLWILFIYSYLCSLYEGENCAKGRNLTLFRRKAGILCASILFSFLGVNGHAGNIVVMLSVFIVFICLALRKISSWGEIFLFSAGTALGVLLCIVKNIKRYLETGSFVANTGWAFRDSTPLFTKTVADAGSPVSKGEDVLNAWMSLSTPELLLDGIGIVAVVFLIVCYVQSKQKVKTFFVLLWVAMLIPLLGIYDVLGYDFSVYFVTQSRYRLHMVSVFAVLAALFIAEMWRLGKGNAQAKIFTYFITLALCFLSVRSTLQNVEVPYPIDEDNLASYHERTSDDIINKYHTTGNIFVSDQVLGYFFRIPTKLGFTEYNHPILAASDNNEVEKAIDDLDMEVFVIGYDSGYYNYDVLPFYSYLQESPDVRRQTYTWRDGHEIDVYAVDKRIWD